jgi:hypothetical protein
LNLKILLKNNTIRSSINKKFAGYNCTPLTLANDLGDKNIIKQLIACGATSVPISSVIVS